MTCQSGTLRSGISEEAAGWRSMLRGATHREWLIIQTPFLDCRVEITAGLMKVHIQKMHGTETEIDWNRLMVSQI